MSGGRNFAFWSYSIIEHLLHPTGLNTYIHPRTQPNLTKFHTKHSDILQTPSAHVQTKIKHYQTQIDTAGTKRHQQTSFDVNLNRHTSSNSLLRCLGLCWDVYWCLLVTFVVLNCPECLAEVTESM